MVIANVIPSEKRQVMIYVHSTYRHTGINVSDTHWVKSLNSLNAISTEPGNVLGFEVRYAVSFVIARWKDKLEKLIMTFARPEDQANLVAMLPQAGFIITLPSKSAG